MSFNPFGKENTVKPAIEVLQNNFGIGYKNFNFGAQRWDENRTNKAGDVEPGWVDDKQERLECVIEFSVNEGKGTGKQSIPASEFAAYVDSLQSIIDTNYAVAAGEDRTQYIPTYEHVGQSFKMVRPKHQVTQSDGSTKSVTIRDADPTVVSVRCTGGKGAKPMLVARDEFPGIVAALAGIASNLDEHIENAQTRYDAELAKKAASAAADNF